MYPNTPTAREYRGDFEVHLTVFAPDDGTRRQFRAWCAEHALKCIWIVLDRGAHADQPMATWRRRNATLPTIRAEAEARTAALGRAGVAVTRIKIEVSPANADVPQTDAEAAEHLPTNYFEHHIKLLRDRGAARDELLKVCAPFGAHLSRNAFREAPDGREERFVTLRDYDLGAGSSGRRFRALLVSLREVGEQVIETESEYCVYDSAVALDAGWLSPNH